MTWSAESEVSSLLAEEQLRPVQDLDDEAEPALRRVRRPPAEPDIEEIPRLAHRRHQGMVDPGPVVAVPLASRLSAVNLRRQAVQVDHEPLRQPGVVHGPDPPPREPRKPVAKAPWRSSPSPAPPPPATAWAATPAPAPEAPSRPVAHPEAQRRVSAQRPRVVVVPAPASPVIRSPRTSILSDLLKPSVHGHHRHLRVRVSSVRHRARPLLSPCLRNVNFALHNDKRSCHYATSNSMLGPPRAGPRA